MSTTQEEATMEIRVLREKLVNEGRHALIAPRCATYIELAVGERLAMIEWFRPFEWEANFFGVPLESPTCSTLTEVLEWVEAQS